VAAAAPIAAVAAADRGWASDWDQAIVRNAVARADAAYDEAEALVTRNVGAAYQYHTNVRSATVHPTRESADYALLLLEAGGAQRRDRAFRILDRILNLQDTDPSSKWYGIWGWYMEEPPPKMSPADWNWADFIGSILLLIEHRHGAALPGNLRRRVRDGIRHAAYSVRRRNVSMNYTNIAVQGTFVTLAAAELLKDQDLHGYARDRLQRFAKNLDLTGSFTEYNSPTYGNVTIANLTRIRQVVKDREALPLVNAIHERAWLHLGKHWHPPTRQLAGPMSRAYSTDIGKPLWIQKALNNRLHFATLEEVRSGQAAAPGEVGLLDYKCPDTVAPLFLELKEPRQHREIFLAADPPVQPVQGTTWLTRDYCLGSVNRGDFWVQRRPLLAYWGSYEEPAKYIRFRFVKDDYDFTSALLYTVQDRGDALALVNFRSPGGDKHPSLDLIQDGEFQAARLRLVVEIAGGAKAAILADGWSVEPAGQTLPAATRLSLDLGGAKLCFQPRRIAFGKNEPTLSIERDGETLNLAVDVLSAPGLVRWRDLASAYMVFTAAMDGGEGSLSAFDQRVAGVSFQETAEAGATRAVWGRLALQGGTTVDLVSAQDGRFAATVDGSPVPLVRLSDERLAG
jgi:hypothetical protein